jgi:hypothetical protein
VESREFTVKRENLISPLPYGERARVRGHKSKIDTNPFRIYILGFLTLDPVG